MHKYGVVPSDPAKPRVMFSDHYYAAAAVIPPSISWASDPTIGMHLNDTWGDCVWGASANRLEIQSYYGTGTEVVITDATVLAGYETTGFNPNAGPPGSNPTDNGTQLIQGLQYMVTPGMQGQTITAYAQLSVPGSINELKSAIAEFGPALLALSLPNTAETQSQEHIPWTIEPNAQILGGHCVLGVGYDATYLYVQTWGIVQAVAWDFFSEYFNEGWAIYSPVWSKPANVSVPTLLAEFNALQPKSGCFLRRALDWVLRGV